jgi:hypothetical protein
MIVRFRTRIERMARNRASRWTLPLLCAIAVVTCVDSPTGPGSRNAGFVNFAFAPRWQKSAHLSTTVLQANGLPLDGVRVVIVRPEHDTLKDTTVVMHEGDAPRPLELTVAGAPGDTLSASMQFKSGTTVLFEGSAVVVSHALTETAGSVSPTEVTVSYVGPGASATSVAVTPHAGVYPTTATIQFAAMASDSAGTVLANTPFVWSVNDTTVGSISTTGLLTPSGKRGNVVVTAATLKDVPVKGAVTDTLAPPPASIIIASGDNQSAAVTQPLAQPLVARVLGADKLGVPGQTVTFAAIDGGTVTTASAVTDTNGRAQTTVKLAARIGAYNFTATSGAFSAGASATALRGVATKMVAVGAASFNLTSGLSAASASFVRVVDAGDNGVPNDTTQVEIIVGTASTLRTQISDADGIVAIPATFSLAAAAGSYTVKITDAKLIGSPITFLVTVLPGAATKLGIVVPPPPAVIDRVAWSKQPSFQLQDVNGNAVAQSGIVVTASIANGTGTLGGTVTATTDARGLATFTDLSIAGVVGARTLSFGATGLSAATVTTTLGSGSAAKMTIFSGTGQSAIVATAVTSVPTVSIVDIDGNPVAGVAVTFAVTAGGGQVVGPSQITDANGSARPTSWTLGPAIGSNSLTASIADAIPGNPAVFTAQGLSATATRLTVATAPPTTVSSGAVFATQPTIQLTDALNNLVTVIGDSITVSLGGDGTLNGSHVAVTNASGLASFTGLSISGATGPRTLTFAATGMVSVTAPTTVVSGAATTLTITAGNNQTATVGTVVSVSPSVRVTDASGNPVSGVAVTFAVSSGGGSITAAIATTGPDGVASVGSWTLGSAAGANTLTATAGSLAGSPATFTATASAGAVHQFSVTGIDGAPIPSQTAGVAFNVKVTALDATGNIVTTYVGTPTLTSNGVLASGGGPTAAFSAGVLAPKSVTINNTGTFTLTVTDGATGTSNAFAVHSGAATQLVLMTAAAGASSGAAFTTQPVVALRDALGNTVTGDYSTAVTMTVSAGATVVGTSTTTVLAGVATFTTVGISGAAGVPYTLSFTVSASSITAATQSVIMAPPIISWTNAAGGSWSNPANWDQARVPTALDSVVIGLAGTYTVTLDTTFTANYIAVGGAAGVQTLSIASRTLTVNGALTVRAGGAFVLSSSNLAGAGQVVNQGILTASGTSSIAGTLTTTSGSTLRIGQVDGCCGVANLTVANGFTNNGVIELTEIVGLGYAAQLSVTSGTLINAAGATITSLGGARAGGARTLTAQLDNRGTITAGAAAPLTIDKASAAHINSGTIDGTAASIQVQQSGTTPSLTNTGTITIGSGQTLAIQGGALNHSGGTLGGAGALSLTSVTAALSVAVTPAALSMSSSSATISTVLSTGTTALSLTNSRIDGTGSVTNASGQTLTLNSTTISTPVSNQGTLIASGSSAVNGTLTTTTTSTLRIGQVDGCCGVANLTVANGFTNNGVIELTEIVGLGYAAQLSVTSGTLINAAGAAINSLGGAHSGGARTLTAQLDNRGTITAGAAAPLTIDKASAAHTNSGTIDATAASIQVQQSGTTPSLTNTGTITIGSSQTLAIQGGALNHTTGTLGGAGTLSLTSVTAALSVAVTPAALTMSSSSATISTLFSTGTTALSLTNSTIDGAGSVTNASGQTLTLKSSTLSTSVANLGTLVASGASSIPGVLTTASGSLLRVGQVDGCCGLANLTVANGFTNNGLIELTELVGNGYGARLTVTSGTLVNAAGGTISALGGLAPGGERSITAAVNNQGTISLYPGAAGVLTINGSLTNTGALNLELGGTTAGTLYDQLAVTGSAILGGTLNVALINGFTPTTGQSFSVLTSSSGLISGTFGTLNLPILQTTMMTALYSPNSVVLIP